MIEWAGVAVAVGIALGVDRVLGEPAARWHPVVGMGRYLGAVGRRIAPVAGAGGTEGRAAARWRPFLGTRDIIDRLRALHAARASPPPVNLEHQRRCRHAMDHN